MRKILAASFFALFAFSSLALAQTPVLLPGGCGSGNITNGQGYETVDSAGRLCSSASANATVTNPTATVTLPTGTTTAYLAGQLIANSPTAGSVVNPSFSTPNSAAAFGVPGGELSTNDTTSTAWGAQTVQVDLWAASPTWTNGDRGTWSPATGTASHIAAFTCVFGAELGDGAFAECYPTVGNGPLRKLASGSTISVSFQSVSGSGVTGAAAGRAMTFTPYLQN